MLTTAAITLIVAVFVASAVEAVEAFTIVLAMGLTRSWKAAIVGTVAAVLALIAITAVVGVALTHYVSKSLLQFIIGALLLTFGLQWLRKSVLRSSGLKAIHDEEKAFAREQEAARLASHETHFGLDWFAFVVSFKGVLLEGLEVVFIVITFGLKAQAKTPGAMLYASGGAVLAILLVTLAGVIARRPLSTVPENTMKYGVALLLSTFGTFWSVEGLGYFRASGQSLEWPNEMWSLIGLLAVWAIISQLTILAIRASARRHQAGPTEGLPAKAGGGQG